MMATIFKHQVLPELPESQNLLQSVVTFDAGTIIFEEYEEGDQAYLIQKGYVEISRYVDNQKKVIALLGPGEIFGEIALLDGKPRTATAKAIHESTVIPISRQRFFDALSSEAPITQLLVQSVVRRLRGMHAEQLVEEEEGLDEFVNKDIVYLETQKRAVEHVQTLHNLSRAVEQQKFQLHFQPIINIGNGALNGYEVLVRGPADMPDLFSPLSFIPMAEESGLIVPLGEWILKYGLRAFQLLQSEAQRRSLSKAMFISINVSPRQLDEEKNVERLVDIISRSHVPPKYIKLEITESMLLSNPQAALAALNRLRSTGLSISIDDFGTGYSSLNYLNRFPLKTLKIDRSFISNLFKDNNGRRIVEAIISLAHKLEMDIVAEGVETRQDHEWLLENGCEYGQGYLYSKPMSLQDSLKMLNKKFV